MSPAGEIKQLINDRYDHFHGSTLVENLGSPGGFIEHTVLHHVLTLRIR